MSRQNKGLPLDKKPVCIKAKARIIAAYLQRKLEEYNALRTEIEELQAEVGESV